METKVDNSTLKISKADIESVFSDYMTSFFGNNIR
jgi:hypothetical protein